MKDNIYSFTKKEKKKIKIDVFQEAKRLALFPIWLMCVIVFIIVFPALALFSLDEKSFKGWKYEIMGYLDVVVLWYFKMEEK